MSQKNDKNVIPNNISPLRYILNETHSQGIKFLQTYEEAKVTTDAVVIMEGDYGGGNWIK